MHILRPPFRMEDDAALDFAARRGFGLAVAADGGDPLGSHIPFIIRRDPGQTVVQFHLTAGNPLVAQAAAGARFLIAVAGPDAYVSNDWYVSEDQVSTWLYEAVHLSGRARLQPVDDNRGHGDALLAVAEARLPKPAWSLETMEPQKRRAMLDGIRVVEVIVDRIEGQSKLNQHKTDADHVAVANRLAWAGTTPAQELARRMRELRPDLVYDFPDADDMP
ncbi:FMN-binding negative transcriptional regulator [Tistrella mobilis]|uniref:FMN-binding negative transcriptional regulator n=1 Tax=Tistrella mobilis TaxID=171437 RepID=UPI003556F202